MAKTELLAMLAAGDFRSGQELADCLGVSRTAVWKQLNRLADLGLELESVKGRGYRIPGGLDLLARDVVIDQLSATAASLLAELQVHQHIDSTNAEALRTLAEGVVSGLAITAEQQSAGRGRRGRTWVSPFARNIYLSLTWQYSQGAAALEGMSLAVGVAVVRALEKLGLVGASLKWPNDVLYQRRKLGGVLLEMVGDASGVCQVVVGVGLNVAMPAAQAEAIDQAWADLAELSGGSPPGRSQVLAALLNELLPLLAGFETEGFAPWREAWMALDAYADQPVIIEAGERRTAGIARGVDARGALQLETSVGIQPVYGGEVSLRASS
jgi:BirA family biotin operon repressor/biotin-[acetyl-CoA-carboxylase] ligase